ncbi:MAG TPA: M4 family metallopeptidase [Kofleriaceae bacterium]
MPSRLHFSKSLIAITLLAGCEANVDGWTKEGGENEDVTDALAQFPEAHVLEWTVDGLPQYVVGEMVKVGAMQSDDPIASDVALRPMLPPVLALFRLKSEDLALRRMNVDEEGNRHFRYTQQHQGLPVIGGDLVVHVDVKGALYSINGSARGDISPALGSSAITETAARSNISADSRFAGLTHTATRMVYIATLEGTTHKAYETIVEGQRGVDPVRDKVYVDVDTGAIVAVYPTIHFALNRRVHSANNGTTIPGTLRRSEGQAATTDVDVNAAYDNTGDSWKAYNMFWSRDSYNNAGASLISTVHYSTNYCNAYWNGTQMTYGDGNSSQGCGPLARSLDVTAHELTHGVTEYESNLVYSGEPGGINEALSDIFGVFVTAWVQGGRTGTLTIDANTWKVGEDVISGGLRNMCDPVSDGASKDYWTTSVGSVDVHYSSGIGNLNFCMLTRGGTHPRGKSNINVPAIGMEKAIRIYYKAQTDILTSSSKYANLRTAMEQATTALGYDQATKDAVSCSWAALGVGTAPQTCGGTTPPPPPPTNDGVLMNGVPQSGLSGAADSQKFWKIDVPASQTTLTITIAGGSGDADLYVLSGSKPTLTSYACRPYKNGNAETCSFAPPTTGTYWVMLHAYTAYSGVTLTGTYSGGGGGGDPYLTNGTAVPNISGASGSAKYWRVAPGAGKTLTIRISGGTGDADMYTRHGARPTTSTYTCRPYLNGNSETCTANNTVAGDYYVMLRGYTTYSGVSLIASY